MCVPFAEAHASDSLPTVGKPGRSPDPVIHPASTIWRSTGTAAQVPDTAEPIQVTVGLEVVEDRL
ncbi:hypothetical protein BRC87_01220 [Halobacteriales archaeon QS_4_66_20]|nr:MAG: hypothetical protein BRC87_01220 [Halobacteriales archaeon QS_4_66_20]